MSEIYKDVKILVSEGLYEEAERRLISHLQTHPRDEEAIRLLANVEKQIFIQKQLQVRIPSRDQAYEDLKQIAELKSDTKEFKQFLKWVESAPPDFLIDLTVVLGSNGWIEAWASQIEHFAKRNPEALVVSETYGWIGRFYLEDNQPLRARSWLEKAIHQFPVSRRSEFPDLWRELKMEYSRCLWKSGERNQALVALQALQKRPSGRSRSSVDDREL